MSVEIYKNIGIRRFGMDGIMKKGQETIGHRHNYDHPTLVVTGSLLVEQIEVPPYIEDEWFKGQTVDPNDPATLIVPWDVLLKNSTKRIVSPAAKPGELIGIAANTWHRIIALEDGTSYVCIFSHRNPKGEVTQRFMGNYEAYV